MTFNKDSDLGSNVERLIEGYISRTVEEAKQKGSDPYLDGNLYINQIIDGVTAQSCPIRTWASMVEGLDPEPYVERLLEQLESLKPK